MMPSRNSYSVSTSHSQKFCAPAGTSCILRVAMPAKTIRPSATIQVTTIELVMKDVLAAADRQGIRRQAVLLVRRAAAWAGGFGGWRRSRPARRSPTIGAPASSTHSNMILITRILKTPNLQGTLCALV